VSGETLVSRNAHAIRILILLACLSWAPLLIGLL